MSDAPYTFPNNVMPEQDEPKSYWQWRHYLVGFLVLCVIVFSGWYFVQKPEPLSRSELNGTIALTLSEEGASAKLYALDVDADTPRRTLGDALNMTEHFSPNARESVYTSVPWNQFDTNFSLLQLYQINYDYEKEQVTDSQTRFKREPRWSPNGNQVVFMALAPEFQQLPFPLATNDWDIYLTDFAGNEQRLTSGAHPRWSPDGRYTIFLKSRGLYAYNVESGTEQELVSSEVPIGWNSIIDISPDGTQLAWSIPGNDTGVVRLFDITSWEPLELRERGGIATHAFWPTFSEDSRYLALQTVEINEGGHVATEPEPKLVVYDTADTRRSLELADLSDFKQESMFITDWRKFR